MRTILISLFQPPTFSLLCDDAFTTHGNSLVSSLYRVKPQYGPEFFSIVKALTGCSKYIFKQSNPTNVLFQRRMLLHGNQVIVGYRSVYGFLSGDVVLVNEFVLDDCWVFCVGSIPHEIVEDGHCDIIHRVLRAMEKL